MPTTTTRARKHQKQWDQLCRDPSLNDLPYKVETNRRGQLVLTPISTDRSVRMSSVMGALDEHAPGRSLPSYAIATPEGVKVPDVIWASEDRIGEMKETGDPTTLAPEVCIEVMSDSNDWAEMEEKRALYREAGAEEVWIVTEDREVRFFKTEEMEESELVSDFPDHL